MNKDSISTSFPEGRLTFFVTSNIHKFNEARSVLDKYKVAIAMLNIKTVEIQDDNLETIAETTAREVVKRCALPIIVEDAGLFVRALKGFPGPYSSYVYRTIGTKGILKLMEDIDDREAQFHSAVVFKSPKKPPKCFNDRVEGEISLEERGSSGFGFDPIFKPSDSHVTFAEMVIEEKNRFSHRAKALNKFAKWYTAKIQRRF